MVPPPPNDFLGLSELSSGFLEDTRVDFAADFDFGANFAAFDNDHDQSGSESPVSVSGLFSGSESPCRRRRRRRLRLRRANRHYRIEKVKTSCWYLNFLAPGSVRDMTYELSLSDRFGEFRHWFRMPLTKVEQLADLFINREYVQPSRSFLRQGEFRERVELLVMSSLYLLGSGAAFRSCRVVCKISTSEIRKFFFLFLDSFYAMRNEYIQLPADMAALNKVTASYESVGLPGACGSMDVVHVKWSKCPAGDYNRAKGKESYPTLAFQCITDFNRRILGVYGPQFGSINDKHIVKIDSNVAEIHHGWFKDVWWRYYDREGVIRNERGAYLICDNGYLRWPETIPPYVGEPSSTVEGYFSSNLESVRNLTRGKIGSTKLNCNK